MEMHKEATFDPTIQPTHTADNAPNPGQIMNPLYMRVGEADAQAQAWVHIAPEKVERYFYMHPQLGAKDVRSRVLYFSICRSDIEKGNGDMPVPYPFCGGHEAVCEVIAVGDQVSSVKVGDKIMCGPVRDSCMSCETCKMGETQMCVGLPETEKQNINGKYFGSFSTHLQQPESHCFKIPDGLNLETLAPMMCAGLTVFRPLTLWTKKGDRVGILGLGGLGHLAVQFAHKMGLTCDAIISKKSMPHYHDIIALGASKIVEWDDADCLGKMQNTYDVILNLLPITLPCEKMDAIVRTIKTTGKLIQVGLPSAKAKFVVSSELIVRRDIEVIGSLCAGTKYTNEMIKFIKNNKDVQAHCEFFEFDDFPKALEHASHADPTFRCVVRTDHAGRKFRQ